MRWIWMPGFFYETNDAGGESKIAERQKERERECERQSVARKEG